jgi:hypothetical protein
MQLTEDYIVGLADGEGSFTAFVRNSPASAVISRRVRIEPRFYVKLIEKDRKVLEGLKDYFKCGNVYLQKDSRLNHQHCYRYEVWNRKDLIEIIIPFFKKNPLRFPSKRKDFQIFCAMLDSISRNEHLTAKGLDRLRELKKQMH